MSRARLVALVMFVGGFISLGAPTQALAQEVVPERIELLTQNFTPAMLNAAAASAIHLSMPEAEPAPAPAQVPISLLPVVPKRPTFSGKSGQSLLTSLYATTALMQALDVHSTYRALQAGAVEGNPAMGGLTKHPGAFVATKAAVAAVSIWAASRMAKKNKVAAVITLVAVNSAYAMVVSNNYRLARGGW